MGYVSAGSASPGNFAANHTPSTSAFLNHVQGQTMAQRLKRWESPRRSGRNHKGRGGSARQRQRKQQLQQLRKRLKSDPTATPPQSPPHSNSVPSREASASLFLWAFPRVFHRPRPWLSDPKFECISLWSNQPEIKRFVVRTLVRPLAKVKCTPCYQIR